MDLLVPAGLNTVWIEYSVALIGQATKVKAHSNQMGFAFYCAFWKNGCQNYSQSDILTHLPFCWQWWME
jgi:hypothetical protein